MMKVVLFCLALAPMAQAFQCTNLFSDPRGIIIDAIWNLKKNNDFELVESNLQPIPQHRVLISKSSTSLEITIEKTDQKAHGYIGGVDIPEAADIRHRTQLLEVLPDETVFYQTFRVTHAYMNDVIRLKDVADGKLLILFTESKYSDEGEIFKDTFYIHVKPKPPPKPKREQKAKETTV